MGLLINTFDNAEHLPRLSIAVARVAIEMEAANIRDERRQLKVLLQAQKRENCWTNGVCGY